jgi:CheY-like chemotaxis protein
MNSETAAPDVPAKSEQNMKGLHILVVEDNEDTANTTAMLLRHYGHEVRIAPDGPAALQAAKERLPDVVLVDIGLPGMDGYEVAMKIGEQPNEKRPLFIAVTGFGSEGYYRLAQGATIDVHLLKPVKPEQLEKLLRKFQTVIT